MHHHTIILDTTTVKQDKHHHLLKTGQTLTPPALENLNHQDLILRRMRDPEEILMIDFLAVLRPGGALLATIDTMIVNVIENEK